MDFYAVLAQVLELLQRQGRVSYRALKVQFSLDDEQLEALKDELIEAQRLATDERGRVLVWIGETEAQPDQPVQSAPSCTHFTSPEAERRQLTVLFCDLVDSTSLARQLDPEDLRQVIRAYQATCAAVIERFAGHIAQYLGDGLLVYFGYPQAHEDDAARAVHTGLGIVEAIGTLNTDLVRDHGVRLAVRVGIHTGLVVVGEMGSGDRPERLALGETPNIAARLQGLAAADTVVISATTQQLVQGLFTCQTLGVPTLKGLDSAAGGLPGAGCQCGTESLRGSGHERLNAAGGASGGGGAVATTLGPGPGRATGRWCCSAARRALANRAWCGSCTTSWRVTGPRI